VKPNPFIPGDMDKTAWKITTNVKSEKLFLDGKPIAPSRKKVFG
jgi:hypothetical protein